MGIPILAQATVIFVKYSGLLYENGLSQWENDFILRII